MMWVQFWDMNSGGGQKEPWKYIYIQAKNEDEAKVIFYNRFGHNPERVTCTCCGDDYSISSNGSLAQLTGYHRGCAYVKGDNGEYRYVERKNPERGWEKYQKLSDYRNNDDVLIISKDAITEDERCGDIPQQGYVWM